ncbi:unnamed protein product [Mycetohabitans rhizoxinica HKI 454]|uniref:Uncharacterized protein n=1 Tax=Mycetohabitans rhizoxinica (strain DSM 19002 / CIP 109453 / HKI 454) TaxID=882378 RepID=E5ATH3_MYCRK|nr:unnamed protein product [Mycetohabitans rhizoxinica HKI 454]
MTGMLRSDCIAYRMTAWQREQTPLQHRQLSIIKRHFDEATDCLL